MMVPAHAQAPGLADIYAPEALRAAYARESQDWQPVPMWIKQTFVLAEDKAFWERAPVASPITRSVTFQFPEDGQTIARSGRRRPLLPTLAIGSTFDRAEILNLFVQGVYLGRGCYGVHAAAPYYFGRPAEKLGWHEAALLAVLIRRPMAIDMPDHQARILQWRNTVLNDMATAGMIPPDEVGPALAQPIGLLPAPSMRCPP